MDNLWKEVVWHQYGAAIDMLGNGIRACPDELWHESLWPGEPEEAAYGQFWYLAFHALFYLDLYLSGAAEGFAPPPPFGLEEMDPAGVLPPRVYTKGELDAYLAHGRAKCRSAIEGLTDERARETCRFVWGELSYAELLLYTMRHVQEHAAQLNLFLGQRTGAGPGWVGRARS